MNERQQFTIEILIASTIQGLSLEEQRNILIATILELVDKKENGRSCTSMYSAT